LSIPFASCCPVVFGVWDLIAQISAYMSFDSSSRRRPNEILTTAPSLSHPGARLSKPVSMV
jgi:hypothetical protein